MKFNIISKIRLRVVIWVSQNKMKRATFKEWKDLEIANKKGDEIQIAICRAKWNSALSKYLQKHLGPFV